MAPQPHGGALRVGSLPGNTPGTGRPPSELRERMRGSLAQRIQIAEEIADAEGSAPADKLRALEFLAKYGLGTTQTQTDTDGNDALPPGRLSVADRRAALMDLLGSPSN